MNITHNVFWKNRREMTEHAIRQRGICSKRVLKAMSTVPRERFLPKYLQEFAYEDSPLPIAQGQTISQPYIVALMTEALELRGGEKVLESGTGSGYAAAVLAEIADEVYSVERIGQLAEKAASTLSDLGYDNVHILHGDGTKGWEEHAPYDGIIVAAGGPEIPETLKQQLKIKGRLVIPVGRDKSAQELVRIIRISETEYKREDLADVKFVPLIGEEGWAERASSEQRSETRSRLRDTTSAMIARVCEPFGSSESASFNLLLNRIADARIVLIGEATHGTSEFYRMRDRISRELITKKGFNFVAIEGDWPDAARVDHYVRHLEFAPSEWTAFARFPTWMWRNSEVKIFVDWLRAYNLNLSPRSRVAFHGLDLYSLYDSIRAVLQYLEKIDPMTARAARERYGCLTPWQSDPATYAHAALTGKYPTCESEVTVVLAELLQRRKAYAEHDGERFLDAVQNARLVANAERYYRTMYYGSRASWNLRDSHMFETLKTLLSFYGSASKAIVWAHNSHVGDASATEMSSRGEYNIGQLCNKEFGNRAYRIGFGTNTGTVAAASEWGGPMEIKSVLPALSQSYEGVCHLSGSQNFLVGLRKLDDATKAALRTPRLERAIGVIYRPETERASHYFKAILPDQFDEYIWFDISQAVTPLDAKMLKGLPDTYPFGL